MIKRLNVSDRILSLPPRYFSCSLVRHGHGRRFSSVTFVFALTLAFSFIAGSRAGAVGAAPPFITVEAESGTTAGGAMPIYLPAATTPLTISTPAMEASGRGYVHLAGQGQSVAISNPVTNATAINVRFSIPDAPAGGGTSATLDMYVNGVFRQALTMNSGQSWLYETSVAHGEGYDSPTAVPNLYPHLFWDEMHVFITAPAVPLGATITFQVDSSNTSAYYDIDCVDLEAPPAALTQPANSRSVLTDGAVGDGITDCTAAFASCIANATANSQSVWIPAGTYLISGRLSPTNLAINGAGMWYTTLYRIPAGSNRTDMVMTGGSIQNLRIDTNSTVRGVGADGDYGIVVGGSNWLIKNLWLQHTQAAIWASGTTGTVNGCRICNTFADGINLNNASGVGNSLTATNNFVRGTGDDGIAINCQNDANGDWAQMQSPVVQHNTIVAPYWADCLRVAGGANDSVAANLCADSATNRGMIVGVYGTYGMGIDSALINNNTILRCGGGAFPYGMEIAGGTGSQAITVDVEANIIQSSLFMGVEVGNSTLTFGPHNNVMGTMLTGIDIMETAVGTGTFSGNVMSGVPAGQQTFDNESTTYTVTKSGNTGF